MASGSHTRPSSLLGVIAAISALLVAFLLLSVAPADATAGLKVGYYSKSCPSAESIVQRTVAGYVARDRTVAAPLLRLHFHDCFVRGCDASVLVNSTRGMVAEKDAEPNMSLDGFYVIDAAKAAVEAQCPGVVSCADITALAARDAVAAINGPRWSAETGRRDGRVSLRTEALANLPSSFGNFTHLIGIFKSKGLNSKDLAVLSGAHTIGNSHCPSFSKRIYPTNAVDPTLDSHYAARLRGKCTTPTDTTTIVQMDPGSDTLFDSHYYQLVAKRRGLFRSDAALLEDPLTRAYVHSRAAGANGQKMFFNDFGAAMIKMGRVQVLTGNQGEIRKNCAAFN